MANTVAQLIKSQLDPFRINFNGGLIWHQLVKHFKKQLSLKQQLSVTGLSGTDIWNLYPLYRFGSYFHVYQNIRNEFIHLSIAPSVHPNFKS